MIGSVEAAVRELLDAHAEAVAAQAKRNEEMRACHALGIPYSWTGLVGGPTRVSLAEDALARVVGRTWPREVPHLPNAACCAPTYFHPAALPTHAMNYAGAQPIVPFTTIVDSGPMPTVNPGQRYGW